MDSNPGLWSRQRIHTQLLTRASHGILHRDLKPGNVLVTTKGSIKLLLATLVAEDGPDATRTMDGTVPGTTAYMSPEQAQGKSVDPRSDTFSFGVILYEMLSGARVFARPSMLETLNAVVREEPPALAHFARDGCR